MAHAGTICHAVCLHHVSCMHVYVMFENVTLFTSQASMQPFRGFAEMGHDSLPHTAARSEVMRLSYYHCGSMCLFCVHAGYSSWTTTSWVHYVSIQVAETHLLNNIIWDFLSSIKDETVWNYIISYWGYPVNEFNWLYVSILYDWERVYTW